MVASVPPRDPAEPCLIPCDRSGRNHPGRSPGFADQPQALAEVSGFRPETGQREALLSRRFRLRRPRHATVVAYLALFIALGGGTALAAVVVSSNSQIGPNTIYGHNAPAGANVNVNLDSVTAADVNESTLARVPSAANGARKFDFDRAKTVNPPLAPILSLNEMSLQARCATNSSSSQTVLEVYVASSVAADLTDTYNASLVPTTKIGAGGSARLLNLVATSGYQRAEGQFTYRNAPRVISGSFHAIANQGTGRCQVNGIETQAPN